MIATAWNARYENEASPTTGVEDEPHTHRFMISARGMNTSEHRHIFECRVMTLNRQKYTVAHGKRRHGLA